MWNLSHSVPNPPVQIAMLAQAGGFQRDFDNVVFLGSEVWWNFWREREREREGEGEMIRRLRK